MMYVLGIDGGGTKTTGVIANEKGEKIAEATVGATNPNSVAKEQVKEEFKTLFQILEEQYQNSMVNVNHVFAGLSGAEHPKTRQEMQMLIESLLPGNKKVTIDNDAITALYSGTLGEPGVVQIAGTGSITYGMNDEGRRKRIGGWGYLFSDHGSGYSVGRDALEYIFLAYDGYPLETSLTKKITQHFNVHQVPDLVRKIYHSKHFRKEIASLSKLVMEAADEGDGIARQIIQQNANHLGKSIAQLIEQLFHARNDHETIPVILVGGLFNQFNLLRSSMKKELSTASVEFIFPKISPVGGAVIAALKEEGFTIDDAFVKTFTSSS